jgi:SecD/SecF fusion protein
MNRSHFYKSLLIVFVMVWSFSQIWPPQSRNLIDQFDAKATSGGTNINAIVALARKNEAEFPARGTYSNLLAAIAASKVDVAQLFPTNYVPLTGNVDPARAILNRLQRDGAGKFKLGLDLQGGTSFLLQMDSSKISTNELGASFTKNMMVEQAVTVLRRRVDQFGVAEPIIQPAGNDQILVQLPGLSESDKEIAKQQIQKAAFLEFRLVDPDNEEHLRSQPPLIPPGFELKRMPYRGADGQQIAVPILVTRKPERGMTGKYISDSKVGRGQLTGAPQINFELNTAGALLFGDITRENIGRRLAIVLDGEVISAPVIQSAITGGSGVITGDFSEKEAENLASALQNPLQTPLTLLNERSVDPKLGKDSIESGIKASIFGVLAVAAFMAIYYLLSGVIANVALLVNILILLGVMCSLNVTYTLPGIAGIVLTIGMAVDANVLIFERIREEQAAGKSVRGSVAAGYGRAFATIFDSHVTTLISAVLLIIFGTGAIKGFGVALTVGVAASLFTALVITRLIFDFLLAKTTVLSGGIRMLHLIRDMNLDFMKLAKIAFAVSWSIIIIGMGYGIFVRGSNMMGIEFAGGDSITLAFNTSAKVPTEALRTAAATAKVGEVGFDYQRDRSTGKETLRVTTLHDEVAAREGRPGNYIKVEEALKKAFPTAEFSRLSTDQVGPIVGQEIQKSAVIASILSLFGILLYVAVRYEFSFAVGAVLAVIHDVFMTIGCYCLTGLMGEGRQFNATFVAALLTIIGFSINDTIVIFDRIREDLKLGVPGSFKDLMNKALNQTLSRTIITSGTVFLATMSLYIFGGGPINDFAFTFLVGIITGTYSSIYIASALVLWWHKGQRPAIGDNATPVGRESGGVRQGAAASA